VLTKIGSPGIVASADTADLRRIVAADSTLTTEASRRHPASHYGWLPVPATSNAATE
jgi:hypothetical protein